MKIWKSQEILGIPGPPWWTGDRGWREAREASQRRGSGAVLAREQTPIAVLAEIPTAPPHIATPASTPPRPARPRPAPRPTLQY